MVQRNKAERKVADEDDQRPKAGKRLLDLSSQNLEGRNRGNDSKKIMKKSASLKLSDVDDIPLPGKKAFSSMSPNLEGRNKGSRSKTIELSDVDDLISLPQMENIVQLGKPPPSVVAQVGVLSKTRVTSPNYMKSTSCSDARKDRKQASLGNGITSTCDTNQARRNLKNSKPDPSGRCLPRSSSLKLGRILTKSPSFKQTGSLKKNMPKASLCSDIHAQRATCSSLLKDSKFPSYVMLSPGATESAGTSIMKICTYKYCSLNGLHHALVPPLRNFISARRRSLKNQKSFKQEGVDSCVIIYGNVKEETAELTPDGTDHEDGSGCFGVPKALNDLDEENGCVEAECESSLDEENGERPLPASGSIEGNFEVENDEELYESLWEAYEMELQEFEFIDAHLDDQVYVKIGSVEEFDCRSGSSFEGSIIVSDDVAKNFFEDELEEGCQEQFLQENTEVEHVAAQQTLEEIEESIADCREEKGNVEDDCSYASSTYEPTDQVLIELNGEDGDNKDELLENLVSEVDQESIVQPDQYIYVLKEKDDESEIRTSDGDGDHEDLFSSDSEEIVTETAKLNHMIKTTKCKAAEQDSDNEKGFNPQEPNYLPLEPEPKSEQVDLRHQIIDERKNSEEWMVDYALQKTVNKLAPVKRKKVELLVEAFETVAPTSKPDHLARRASFPFANIRAIQACN